MDLKKVFFDKVSKTVSGMNDTNDRIIMGGDFNGVLHANDNLAGILHTDAEITKFNVMIDSLGVIDSWRYHNVSKKDYSWSNKTKTAIRRLDYLFFNDNAFDMVTSCDIIDAPLTDHRAVISHFQKNYIQERGPGFWKMNSYSYL